MDMFEGVGRRLDQRTGSFLDIGQHSLNGRERNCRQPAELLHNGGPARHWIEVRLVGVASNRDAVGARLRLHTAAGWQTREVHAGSAYLSGQSLVQHFGLGDATRVDALDIAWPSGERTALGTLDADRRYLIVEGGRGAATLH